MRATVRRWRRARPPEGPEQAGGRPPQVAVAPTGHVGPPPLARVVAPMHETCRWPAVTHAGAWSLVAVCSAGGGAGAGGGVGCPGCLWRRPDMWAGSWRLALSRRRTKRAAGQPPQRREGCRGAVGRWGVGGPPASGPSQTDEMVVGARWAVGVWLAVRRFWAPRESWRGDLAYPR